VHPPLVQVAAYHRKKARSQNVARVAREGATVEKDVVFQEADDNMYQLIGACPFAQHFGFDRSVDENRIEQ
jgi:hypothetical protein